MDTLRAAGADSALIDLVAALHAESTYSFRTQGQEGQVVSTTGIKQGCKLAPTLFSMLTGTIFRELIALVGVQAVVDYLTGYADDLTVHREIHSMEDLGRAHALIEQLLALVRKHGFAVNPSKCTMMVKLEGTQAQRALRRFTYWRTAPDGQRQKMWRLGPAKSHEGFPSVTSFKYLGVMLSYGNFEKATLKHRLQEGNAKLQQVRRFVHNRPSFSLRHVTPTWRYDGSQQDASEDLTALFRGLSSFPISRPWETKDPETGSTLDRGGPLLLLPTPVGQDTASLQDLLDAWSGTPAHTALNGQQSLVTVAVARFVEGRKLHYTLFQGWVQSCIFHIGDGPHSGHYRCIWRKTSDDNWQSTDDGRSSVAASESDMRQARNGGYILLVRPFLQDQPVAGPP